MIKFLKGTLVAALLFFWLAPVGLMISDGFWWLLTDHQWSSLTYNGARAYFTFMWSFIMAFPCLYLVGVTLDD